MDRMPDMKEEKVKSDIAATLGIDDSRRSRFGSVKWFLLGIAILAVFAVVLVSRSANDSAQVRYKTEEVRRGNLVVTVSATGNLEPTNQVDVSSELSGIVDAVKVDYNDKVEAGQVLAELDTDKLKAQALQSEAALAAAEAKVRETKASVRETQLKFQRCQRLAAKKLCAEEEVDTGRAAYLRAQAEQGLAEAQVEQARAKLDADRTDLGKIGDLLARQRRGSGARGRTRADRGHLTAGPGIVHAGRGSFADGVACGRRRGGRGPGRRRPDSDLHRRCLP